MEPDWNTAPPFGRRETLLQTLRQLHALHPGPVCIVETGTTRSDAPRAKDGDGWSIVAWGWYAQCVGGRVFTVDCDAAALQICRRVSAHFASAIEYVHSDSVAFLREWDAEQHGPIHLLYLDSFDWIDKDGSERHNLAEAEAVLPHLAPAALILIDDMHPAGEPDAEGVPPFDGKGKQTVPFLRQQGFRVEWFAGAQVLLSRGVPDHLRLPFQVAPPQVSTPATASTPPPAAGAGPLPYRSAARQPRQETRKCYSRWLREGLFDRVLVGHGLEIGCQDAPLTRDCEQWPTGGLEAQELSGVPPARFDWVYSSYTLQELPDPARAVQRWWEVLKPGGHLLLLVPDEDLYEQGHWPSPFNPNHRWTITIHKPGSWSPVSISLAALVAILADHQVLSLRTLDDRYDYSGGVWDRTASAGLAHIEALVRKAKR